MIRTLDTSDLWTMKLLRLQRKNHAGFSVDAFTNTPLLEINTRYFKHPNLAVGYVDEDAKLKAFICAYSAEDFWVLDLMISDGDPKHLQECLEHCLQVFESRDIKKFYYAFPQKWARAYRSFWKDGALTLKKYTISDICVLEAYKIPSEHWIWEHVLHNIVIPVPLLLRLSNAESSC